MRHATHETRGWRIASLQWVVGTFCVLLGAISLVVPHRLIIPAFELFGGFRFALGSWAALAGFGLLAVAALSPPRLFMLAAHGLAGTLGLALAGGLALTGDWIGAGMAALLAVATLAAPWLPAAPSSAEPAASRDLLALLLGLAGVFQGVCTLAFPALLDDSLYRWYGPFVPWLGAAFVLAGLGLVVVQLHLRPSRTLQVAAHWAFAAVYAIFGVVGLAPSGRWAALAFFLLVALCIACQPWLSTWTRHVDLAALQTRLAFTLALLLSLPLVFVVGVAIEQTGNAALASEEARQVHRANTLATELARDIVATRVVVAALARPSEPAAPRTEPPPRLDGLLAAYQPALRLSLHDSDGRALPDHGVAPAGRAVEPWLLAALSGSAEPVARPSLTVDGTPVVYVGTRLPRASGEPETYLLASVDVRALLQASQTAGSVPRYLALRDETSGRVVQLGSLTTNASSAPAHPVAFPPRAAAGAAAASWRYREAGEDYLAASAAIRDLPWTLAVASAPSQEIATHYQGRDWGFFGLLLAFALSLGVGLVTAGRVAHPLATLEHTVKAMVAGDTSAPLPARGVTEVMRLARAVGTLRDQLAARTAEREAAEQALRGLNADLEQRVAQRTDQLRAQVAEQERVQARLQRQSLALVDLAREPLADDRSLGDLLHPLTRAVALTLQVERASVWLLSPDGSRLQCVDLYERAADWHGAADDLLVADFPGYFHALNAERTIAADDAKHDARTRQLIDRFPGLCGIGALLLTSVHVMGQLVGVVCSAHRGGPRRWTLDEQTFAGSVADLVALRLQAHERGRTAEMLHRQEEQLRQVQKMDAVGQLAGGVAHDFNNILTVINGCSALLEGELAPHDPRHQLAADITQAGERAAALTRQLLAFSRRQMLTPRQLDPNAIVEDTIKLLRRLIREDIELVTWLQPELSQVRVDPGQLQQVLMNLAVNGRDAMPTGGQLTITTRNVELHAALPTASGTLLPGHYVQISVSDTGCGMDAATREHLFEPFFTTKGVGKGTGLGLATVYGIATQSGGHITVDSAPGRGSAFRLYLPALAPEPLPPTAPANCPPRGSETILLAEDEDQVRKLVRGVLQQYGYTVIESSRGEEALERALSYPEPISLLLTDVVMPGMSGRELAQRLLARWPTLQVLYMTGHTDDLVVRHGAAEDDAAVLQKPFTPTALLARVRQVLDRQPTVL